MNRRNLDFFFTEHSDVFHGVRKRHSEILCCDHIFDHSESRTGMRRKMSILNYFKRKETPFGCLERIDKNNETSSSLQLESTEMECAIELKSVEPKGE